MYNSMSAFPKAAYNILTYLANSPEAEDIWKMLKYNSYDALNQDALTLEEKIALLWREGAQEKYGVFLTPLVEDAITESKCILKIYSFHIHPDNLYSSVVVYGFDFLYGGNMALVDCDGTPVSRGDLFVNKLLTTLNGVQIGGVGELIFLDEFSPYALSKTTIGNNKTFTGQQIFLATRMGDRGVVENCVD